jgi:hypothetical protein
MLLLLLVTEVAMVGSNRSSKVRAKPDRVPGSVMQQQHGSFETRSTLRLQLLYATTPGADN